jgi:hypothetical protein
MRTFAALSFALLLLLPSTALTETGEEYGWQFLGLPYITADPDFGIIFGAGVGIAKPPRTNFLVNTSISTGGQMGLTLRGEVGSERSSQVFIFRQWLNPAGVYSPIGALPEAEAVAQLQRTEIKIAFLRRYSEHLEFGPELWNDFSKGIDPETPDGDPVNVAGIPRYRIGGLTLAGLRARYRTTSATRPTDGVIIDAAVRAGRADGIDYTHPRPTIAGDFWISKAKPISQNLRLYGRVWFRAQSEAPVSVRNDLGGVFSLRGQPYNRDYGRRLIAGRFQLHWTLIRGFTTFSDIAQMIIPPFPDWPLNLEVAPFADIGAVGDPDIGGWRRTRQGYGLSIRFVLPPELVFFFDIGYSPEGRPLLYFGGGETI